MLYIEQVFLGMQMHEFFATTIDLPPTSYALRHGETFALPGFVLFDQVRQFWTGTTKLISPLSTLNIWGNSSRLVRRRKRPTLVTRGSPGCLWTRWPCPSVCSTKPRSSSAFCTIVRNLNISKRRPFSPARFCRNSTGPGLLSRIARATKPSSGKMKR